MSTSTFPVNIDQVPDHGALEVQVDSGDRLFRVRPVLHPRPREFKFVRTVGPWSPWWPADNPPERIEWDSLWRRDRHG